MAKKYTVKGVAGVIASEGLGYAVKDYISGDMIADPKLAKMWNEAAKLLEQIEEYVNADKIEVED